jgi:hypothetical protein
VPNYLWKMFKFLNREQYLARVWSNQELKKFSHLFKGKVINVSGWNDSDKEGKKYKDYFKNASGYCISNFKDERGYKGNVDEIYLDLEAELPGELVKMFDVVFNHTTLEHIYEFKKAFENLCLLSKDILIVVVPFSQRQHEKATINDYWRFSPRALRVLSEENGFITLYQSSNKNIFSAVYVFHIATRNPAIWKKVIGINLKSKAGDKIGKIPGVDSLRRIVRLFK